MVFDIAPAQSEIITVCNVGQAKPGHGACMKSINTMQGFILTAREMHFSGRLDINFDKVNVG